jgi:hypothetical protein
VVERAASLARFARSAERIEGAIFSIAEQTSLSLVPAHRTGKRDIEWVAVRTEGIGMAPAFFTSSALPFQIVQR